MASNSDTDNPLKISHKGEVALLELDDGKANALGHLAIDAILKGLDDVEDAGAVVIAGRPERFSAGFDLAVMKASEEQAREMLRSGVELFLRCYMFPRPIVAACTGHALAAGAILLMCCDLRVGTKGNFKIGLPELSIGMSLPFFATELAKNRLSKRHFTKATMLGAVYNPEEACDVGFLDVLEEPNNVIPKAIDHAEPLTAIGKKQLSLTRSSSRGSTVSKIKDELEKDLSLFVTGD